MLFIYKITSSRSYSLESELFVNVFDYFLRTK